MTPKTPEAELGLALLTKTVRLIQHYHKLNPNVRYYIENPVGRMQYEPILQELPGMIQYTVSYCKFGFDYRKNTHIWSNDVSLGKLLPKPCTKANLCPAAAANGGRHPVGVRGHPENGMATGPKDLWERYRQPGGLWRTIFRFDKLKVLTVGDGEAAEMEAETMTLPSTSSEEKLFVPEPEPEPEPGYLSQTLSRNSSTSSNSSVSWWGRG